MKNYSDVIVHKTSGGTFVYTGFESDGQAVRWAEDNITTGEWTYAFTLNVPVGDLDKS